MSGGLIETCDDGTRLFWCPGCKCGHALDSRWTVTGPPDRPSASPSVLHFADGDGSGKPPGSSNPRCHLFIREGRLQFLADCTHALAGSTVDMEPL